MNNVELTIRYLAIDCLKPYARNARKHNKAQIRLIAESIKAVGFTNPIIINQHNMIIAGHGRVEAAKFIGMRTVPTVCLEHLSEAQICAYIIADNRLAERSGWDKEILATELQYLMTVESDVNINITGFDDPEIEMIVHGFSEEEKDEDPFELSSGPAISILGDLWHLGEHRILCGDATKVETLQYLMGGCKAELCFTDPPYNVNYGSTGKSKKRRPITNDNLGSGFPSFLSATCRNILSATDGAIYICMASGELHTLYEAFTGAGGHWSDFIIWAKNTFTIGRSDYQRQYEPILYGWRKGSQHSWCGRRDHGDLWFFDKPSRSDEHPTMKPVGLVMRAIRNSSKYNSIVLDPFLGSGTTLIAAERTKRICYGIELDQLYVDAAIRRWQRHTGFQAIHAVTGKSFNETAAI